MKPSSNYHSFSRTFAREHSVNEAVILKFVAAKVRKSNNIQDEKPWYYNPISKIAEMIPAISAAAIDANLVKMEKKGLVEFGNFNKMPQDRTRWYHVPKPFVKDVEKDLITFDVRIAMKQGIPASVIYHNLKYWLQTELAKTKGTDVAHEMSPTKLKEILPFSEAAIKKALAKLVKDNLILKTSATKPEYTLPQDELNALRLESKLRE